MLRSRARLLPSIAFALAVAPGGAEAAPRLFTIYAVWMHGEGDTDRNQIDAFMDCLIERSTFAEYFGQDAIVGYAGSWAVAPPSGTVDTQGTGGWVDAAIRAGTLPHAPAETTPVYLILGSSASMNMDGTGACGRNAPGTVDGRTAGLATVRVRPACWNTGDPIRSDTQLSEHEVAEVIDQLLGFWGCAGDGSCEGSSRCGVSACSNFIGLSCPGAPASSATGCGGITVHGWVVQKLSHQERLPNNCDICTSCDFSPAPGCTGRQKTVNQPCASSGDCCSGLACKAWSYGGHPPFQDACCKDVGASCGAGTECCGGSGCDPASHKCACVPAGQWCINLGECCAGFECDLAETKCVPLPPDAGAHDNGESDRGSPSADDGSVSAEGGIFDGELNEGHDARTTGDSASADAPLKPHRCACTQGRASRPDALSAAALLLAALFTRPRCAYRRRRARMDRS